MANLQVQGGVRIDLLTNGDNLATTLIATAPLYQTFKKGTQNYSPDWSTMDDALRPVVFPRIYSVMESAAKAPTDVSWKYNGADMTFDTKGVAIAPELAIGKIKQIDYTYNGKVVKALRMIGNVANSVNNNDSDTITFKGKVQASGQEISVTADATILIEEASNNLYKLFLNMDDDVLDGDETSLTMTAALYNNGAIVNTGVQFEFKDALGTILKAKGTSSTLSITKEMVDNELMILCNAYVDNVVVASEQKQVWDSTDPFAVLCNQGNKTNQHSDEDVIYSFSLLNLRTNTTVTGTVFVFNIIRLSDNADITAQFNSTDTSITMPGAKMYEHKSIYIGASCIITR